MRMIHTSGRSITTFGQFRTTSGHSITSSCLFKTTSGQLEPLPLRTTYLRTTSGQF